MTILTSKSSIEQRLELATAGVDGDCWTHENCTSFLYDPPDEEP